MKNRFLKKVSIYFVGTLSSNLINVLLVPVYAYFVGTEDLGEYDYLLSIVTMVIPIAYMVIWESILKYCINEEEEKRNQYLSTALFFSMIVSFVGILICVVMGILGVQKEFLFLLGTMIILGGLTFQWQFSARALGESKQYVIAGIVGSCVVILCDLMYIVFGTLDYVGLSVSHILSQIMIIFILEKKIHLFTIFRTRFIKGDVLKKMLCFSAPLVLNNVSMWFYAGGNKIIVRKFIGASENGLYSFASKFSILINLCSTIISMAVIEEAYSYKSLEEYRVKIGKLIGIISKAYFSMISLALPAIYILYTIAFKNTEYYASSDYVFMLLLSALFTALSNNFGSSFQVTGNTKLIFLTTIAGAMGSLGASLLLVKKYDIWGVLVGAVVGPLVMMCLRAIYAKKATGLKINWWQNFAIIFLSICACVVLNLFDNLLVQILVLVTVAIILSFIYRREISVLLKRKTRN